MSWKEDKARVLSRSIEGTSQGPKSRQQLRLIDREGKAEQATVARIRARKMASLASKTKAIADRSRRQRATLAKKPKVARSWVRCGGCGHLCSPFGLANRHHCPAVAS